MIQKIIFLVIPIALFFSCSNDKNPDTSTKKSNSETLLLNVKKSILKRDTLVLKDSTKANAKGAIIKTSSKKIKENKKVKEEKAKLQKKKEKVFDEKIKSSTYKKMNCQDIIEKYKKIIEEYRATKNEELLIWIDTNDPIYTFCHKEHIAVFDSLDRVLSEIDDDEQY